MYDMRTGAMPGRIGSEMCFAGFDLGFSDLGIQSYEFRKLFIQSVHKLT